MILKGWVRVGLKDGCPTADAIPEPDLMPEGVPYFKTMHKQISRFVNTNDRVRDAVLAT
jgi:hypothetical protein